MSAIWRCILMSLLISSTLVPEPAAMRRLRWRRAPSGLRRSCGVIEVMMACWRFRTPSSRLASAICDLILPMPGSMPSTPRHAADLLHLLQLLGHVVEIEGALLHLLRRSSAPSRRRSSAPPSRRARRRRPCRGCAPATRAGWKSSSASHFSPTPMSLIGLPVTARIDSAAPPRASPSARVSTMPVMPTRWSNDLATLTASWPVRLSATSSVSCGCAMSRISADLRHQRFVDVGAARRVEHHHVVAAEPRPHRARAWRSAAASARR